MADFMQRSDEFNIKKHLETAPYFWYSPEANLQEHLKKQQAAHALDQNLNAGTRVGGLGRTSVFG